MANQLLTINMITREAMRLWKNSNEFIQHVDTQYDDQFARTGAKIGQSLRIRLPNDFTVGTGPAISVQDTAEQSVTLTLATQKNVPMAYSSGERSLSLDDFSKRVLAPAINSLAGAVALDVISGADTGVCNFAANLDSSGNVLTPTATTWLQAGAILDLNSAPRENRKAILNPVTVANTVGSLAGLFNPTTEIGKQTKTGQMFSLLGFDWYSDQTVLSHTTAAYAAMTVNGANQTGTVLTVNTLTGPLAAGDIIYIDGVNQVNRITKQSTGKPRTFTVTQAAATGATTLSIYPAIIPGNSAQGVTTQVQYQTVDLSPANGATIHVATVASATYRKNFTFVPEAVTMVTADLELPEGVHERAREVFDGVSLRLISAYNVMTDQFVTRLDVLYGWLWVRPEWAVIVADNV
jgi:hypothetical protein